MSWLLALSFCLCFAQEDQDENHNDAKELYQKGEKHFDRGQYTQALKYFKDAYDLMGHYKLLFNIALAYQFSGELQKARETFVEYQRMAPASFWDEAQTRIDAIDDILREQEETKEKTTDPPTVPLPISIHPFTAYPWLEPTLWGVGATSLAVGIYGGVATLGNREIIDQYCNNDVCTYEAKKILQSWGNHALMADIGIGLGVSAIATAIIFRGTHKTISISPSSFMIQGEF